MGSVGGSSATSRYKPNTILNQQKSVVEKRDDLLWEFFHGCKLEFRLTIGDNWDNYIAKSDDDEAFIQKLT